MRLASAWRVLVAGIHERKVQMKRRHHAHLTSKMFDAANSPLPRSIAECKDIEAWALEVYKQDFLLMTPAELRVFSQNITLKVTNQTELLFLQGQIGKNVSLWYILFSEFPSNILYCSSDLIPFPK